MKTLDLARYLWGVTVLGINDKELVDFVLKEYNVRVQNYRNELKLQDERMDGTTSLASSSQPLSIGSGGGLSSVSQTSLTVEKLATMLWTLGCVKDTLGWTDVTLAMDIASLVSSSNPRSLSSRLIVRVLWSMTVQGIYDETLFKKGLDILVSRPTEQLSLRNTIVLLWVCAQSKFRDVNTLRILLDRLTSSLRTEPRHNLPGLQQCHLAMESLDFFCNDLNAADTISNTNASTTSISTVPSVSSFSNSLCTAMASLARLLETHLADMSFSSICKVVHLLSRTRSGTVRTWETFGKQLVKCIENGSPLNATEAIHLIEAMNDPHTLLPEIMKKKRRMHNQRMHSSHEKETKNMRRNEEIAEGEEGDEVDQGVDVEAEESAKSTDESVEKRRDVHEKISNVHRVALKTLMMSNTWLEIAGFMSAYLVTHSDDVDDINKLVDIAWKINEICDIIYVPLILKIQFNLCSVMKHDEKPQLSDLLQLINIGRLFQLLHKANLDADTLALAPPSFSTPFVLAASTDFLDPFFIELVENVVTSSDLLDKIDTFDDYLGLILSLSHLRSTRNLPESKAGDPKLTKIKRYLHLDASKLQPLSRHQLAKLLWAATQPNKFVTFEIPALISIVKELHKRSWKSDDIFLYDDMRKNIHGLIVDGASSTLWEDVTVTLRALLEVERRINSDAAEKLATDDEIENAVLLVQLHRRLLLGKIHIDRLTFSFYFSHLGFFNTISPFSSDLLLTRFESPFGCNSASLLQVIIDTHTQARPLNDDMIERVRRFLLQGLGGEMQDSGNTGRTEKYNQKSKFLSISDRYRGGRESFYKGVTFALQRELQDFFPHSDMGGEERQGKDNDFSNIRLVDKGKRFLTNLFVYLS